ncbi:MAG: transglutaminase N-terminal domain-containing protein [Phycisphaerae bacterium]|nr:transglutaminase family protein [Tepidisphaeraceae bacterium]
MISDRTGNPRRLQIRHTTRYTYDQPVKRSAHRLHLCPISDARQRLLDYKLEVSTPVDVIDFEDVFGARTERFEIVTPYTELTIAATSTVELSDFDPFAFAKIPIRPSYPLVWMPWERLMLQPYLTPVELPDTQLQEITEYAMGFVNRNDQDLMEALFAINLAFKRDYTYAPGSTTLGTTPYEVMVNKRGVCQDFANLFICMARLLGIPARYVCGYIHTGNNGENRLGCDATHAWVQLYIPNVGWKGFDPTNGTLPHLDHVRVAYGRHYRDTAPTSGTLYSPANETLWIDVEVTDLDAPKLEGSGATTSCQMAQPVGAV